MANTPKYDNDYVTLGYLNKSLNAVSETTDTKINEIPKSYNSPPVTPYYANSILLLNGQIYKCIKSRLVGSFNMSDWELVVETNSIDEALKTIYDVNKFEYVDQEDGIIETFYQEDDPSLEWETDLEKNLHVSDLWTTDGEEMYQYTKTATNPIEFSWIKRQVPICLFDTIDGYKRLFLSEPTNYSKGDLWFGSVTKVAINNSVTYNDSDWINRDEYIEATEIEQEEYHKIYVIPNITEINRQSNAEFKKALDEIMLSVSQTYTTKTEMIEYVDDEKQDIISTQETQNSQITLLQLTQANIKQLAEETQSIVDQETQKMIELQEKVETNQTSTSYQINVINETLENGVSKVKTSTGYTFDDDGLNISKEGEEMQNSLTNTGMYVKRSETDILTADPTGVNAINLHARRYLSVGTHSRWEDYEDGTGCFIVE